VILQRLKHDGLTSKHEVARAVNW